MNGYEKAVSENLKHMGTDASEWSSVPVVGFSDIDVNGKTVSAPQFEFPKDYSEAPTLYKSGGKDACCGLCGHPIKWVYWIQNDGRKWILPVGSECVTHFKDGKSGARVAKEARWALNRAFFEECESALERFFDKFSKVVWVRKGYHSYQARRFSYVSATFVAEYNELKEMCDRVRKYGAPDNGTLTRWVKRYGDEARDLKAEVERKILERTDR